MSFRTYFPTLRTCMKVFLHWISRPLVEFKQFECWMNSVVRTKRFWETIDGSNISFACRMIYSSSHPFILSMHIRLFIQTIIQSSCHFLPAVVGTKDESNRQEERMKTHHTLLFLLGSTEGSSDEGDARQNKSCSNPRLFIHAPICIIFQAESGFFETPVEEKMMSWMNSFDKSQSQAKREADGRRKRIQSDTLSLGIRTRCDGGGKFRSALEIH